MGDVNQSLVRIYKNAEDNVVLAYGSAVNCDLQSVDLEVIVIDQADIETIANALLDFKLKNKEDSE